MSDITHKTRETSGRSLSSASDAILLTHQSVTSMGNVLFRKYNR